MMICKQDITVSKYGVGCIETGVEIWDEGGR